MQTEERPRLAAEPSGGMHEGEGFGAVWADDDGGDNDSGWDGGADFAGFNDCGAMFYGAGAACGGPPDDLEPGALPRPLSGASGLTPLAGAALLQLPCQRPRMKVRAPCYCGPAVTPQTVLPHACLQQATRLIKCGRTSIYGSGSRAQGLQDASVHCGGQSSARDDQLAPATCPSCLDTTHGWRSAASGRTMAAVLGGPYSTWLKTAHACRRSTTCRPSTSTCAP